MFNNLFTKEEKKNAKRDYKEHQKLNPAGFKNQRNQFKANFVDKLANALKKNDIKFNLTKIGELDKRSYVRVA